MKWLIILLCFFCTCAAPLELTRLIVEYGFDFKTILELTLMWIEYLIFIGVLIKVVKG